MKSSDHNATTDEFDREVLAYWAQVATSLGFPRSTGECYGLIFLNPKPLNANEIASNLGISRSGVGQILKLLTEIGAIRPALHIQKRKEHYELQPDHSIFFRLYLNSRVLPRLDELGRQYMALSELAKNEGPPHTINRFKKLDRWRTKTSPLLYFLKSLAMD